MLKMPLKAIKPSYNLEFGSRVLKKLVMQGDILGALTMMHREAGDVFRIPLPGFNPVVLAGPEANRFLLVERRGDVRWRVERDPVVRLLRHGLLVEDGEAHDRLRKIMSQALHKRMLRGYVEAIWRRTDQVTSTWPENGTVDMLVEMRKAALLIFMDTLFGIDFSQEIGLLWSAITRSIEFISPGLWIFWPEMPRPGYTASIAHMNEFLYRIIRQRRESQEFHDDLLSTLVQSPGMNDELIRDQLLTMLIAGHDTSTAMLAWALYLLGAHPDVLQKAAAEVHQVLGDELPLVEHASQLEFLNQVINETARMYPPIHIGNRIAAVDMEFQGQPIPAGTRLMYSIYLTHRDLRYWPEPDSFKPERFASGGLSFPPYSYVPFGGGPRNCIGMAFARLEVNLVLARLLQGFEFVLLNQKIKPHMGATLEPRPGVFMQVHRRKSK
jgi:cytochrome P450